jgi:hypothetical protein
MFNLADQTAYFQQLRLLEEVEEETVLELVKPLLLIMDFPGVLVAAVDFQQSQVLVLEARGIHLQHLQVKVTRGQQIPL